MAKDELLQAYKDANYQLHGHGIRNIQVLQKAIMSLDEDQESDMYGQGKIIEEFQEKMADFLGKESAVFFPSGTMAQQIALRIWADEKHKYKVAYHPLCHLEIHEEDGLKELHKIETVLLADESRVIELEDVVNMQEDIACLLLELPQREIGGKLPSYEMLESISSYCKERGIRLHLDGARLYEVLPYYKKTASEICRLFDSVYISFYKGIGGVAGAILAGSQEFMKESKIWKKRYGGDLISLYPYIVAADYYFEERLHKMEQYYRAAVELAKLYNGCSKVSTIPEIPVSNMFHVHIDAPKEVLQRIFTELYKETGIGITGYIKEKSDGNSTYEVSIGDQYNKIPKETLKNLFEQLNEELK
ncbi:MULTISPECIES: threonine aldolase family protein [Bacillus]|uniref:threonine aldolase family protein n=1 Tax=Bacillus TaxID=1386 RepID=UPI000BB742E6|nr:MULTISPECIES: aminotransferase class I/II-fold pyridoxal phosphate-dependent enzyme [Bacillus]